MTRRIRWTLVGCLLAALMLAACGAPPAAEPAAPAEEPAAEEEVVQIEETVEEEAAALEGEIVISIASNDIQTYQAPGRCLHGHQPGR